jgi:uncharacterized protein (DUF885 family)
MKRSIILLFITYFLFHQSNAQTNSSSYNQGVNNETVAAATARLTSNGKVDSVALKQLLSTQNKAYNSNSTADPSLIKNPNAASAIGIKSNNPVPIAISIKDKMGFTNAFASYKENFIKNLWRMYPEWATSVGYHNYDSLLTVSDDQFRLRESNFIQKSKAMLLAINKDSLSTSDQMDYLQINNFLEQNLWSSTQLKQYQWDPSMYNVAGNFSFILTENYSTLNERLKSLFNKMNYVDAYYAAARKNIQNPTKEHTALAISQLKGGLSVFTTDVLDSLKKSTLPADVKAEFIRRAALCASSTEMFITFLQSIDLTTARSFRLRAVLYESKFKYDIQSNYSTKELLQLAKDRKAFLHEDMLQLAISMWSKYFPEKPMPAEKFMLIRMVIDTISTQHSSPENFQSNIEKQIPLLIKFINDKKLIYLDPSKPLKVRKEPDYMAGVAGASISAPGPYDKNGNTYYNVGSLAYMSEKEQESYLREYNDYILQILNIHEAIPGHYTQGIYANQSPSIIKTILGNGSMVEGWAVYSELMMIENGYGGNTPEMRLMYDKWNLRSVCNTILDISVHTLDMSEEEAKKLLITEAFQQAAEADGKWKRAQLTSVQLCSYFNGFKEIIDLREEMKKKEGEKFSLKSFNEKFLSYGNIPVKNIRQLMLQ